MCHRLANNKTTQMLLANNQQTVIVEALLEKGGSVSIHNCNLRILPTEMYEITYLL